MKKLFSLAIIMFVFAFVIGTAVFIVDEGIKSDTSNANQIENFMNRSSAASQPVPVAQAAPLPDKLTFSHQNEILVAKSDNAGTSQIVSDTVIAFEDSLSIIELTLLNIKMSLASSTHF